MTRGCVKTSGYTVNICFIIFETQLLSFTIIVNGFVWGFLPKGKNKANVKESLLLYKLIAFTLDKADPSTNSSQLRYLDA